MQSLTHQKAHTASLGNLLQVFFSFHSSLSIFLLYHGSRFGFWYPNQQNVQSLGRRIHVVDFQWSAIYY